MRRLANAEALGMTYRAYTLEIMERGRHPTERPSTPSSSPEVMAESDTAIYLPPIGPQWRRRIRRFKR